MSSKESALVVSPSEEGANVGTTRNDSPTSVAAMSWTEFLEKVGVSDEQEDLEFVFEDGDGDDDSDDEMSVEEDEWVAASSLSTDGASGQQWLSARSNLQNNATLAWRLDPEESHSDFLIVVQCEGGEDLDQEKAVENESVNEYRVHKVFLSVGPYKSGYLSSLFAQKNSFVENQGNKVVIKVPDMAARAFPMVLDLVYSQGAQGAGLDGSAETTVGAMFLADYLDIPALREFCQELLKRELKCENCHEYYECATGLQQEKVLRQIEGFVQANVKNIEPQSPLWKVLSMESMVEVIASGRHLNSFPCTFESGTGKLMDVSCLKLPNSLSRHFSKLVLAFMEHHETTAETFRVLTQEEYLPCIDKTVAIQLMDLENKFCGSSGDTVEETSLRKRCSEPMLYLLREVDFKDTKHEVFEFLRRSPSKFVVDALLDYVNKRGEFVFDVDSDELDVWDE